MDKVLAALSSIPATAWTAFGTALIAFFGVWLTNWNNRQSLKMQLEHEERLHRQRLSKDRLEELYGLVTNWGNAIYLHCEGLHNLARNQISLEQFRNHIAAPNMPTSNLGRLEMIAGIYGDTLKNVFSEALDIKDEIVEFDDLIVKANISGATSGHLAAPLVDLQSRFVQCITTFKTEIVKAAKEV